MYFVNLNTSEFFAFQKLGNLVGSEPEAAVVAKVNRVKADIFFSIFYFGKVHANPLSTSRIFFYQPELPFHLQEESTSE